MTKAPYKTKQMTEILTFLKSVQGRHVTVNEICDFFREKGISVGTTTIYREVSISQQINSVRMNDEHYEKRANDIQTELANREFFPEV